MKRVVITGMGIVSSLGNNKEEVLSSLKQGKSGITFQQEYADMGFRSHVAGAEGPVPQAVLAVTQHQPHYRVVFPAG